MILTGDLFEGAQPRAESSRVDQANVAVALLCQAAGRNMTRTEWEQLGRRDTECNSTFPQYEIEV